MAWYNTGTIALTNGSATVTGSGTNFLVGAQIGEALYAPDGKLYEIQTIDSATVITLASNYLGSTASTQGYQIIPTQSLVADLASDVTDLISDFADVRDYAGNGKFNDGAVGTPGITFTQDQDNGLYRIGSNNWALAAGGQQVVNLTTTAMNFPDNNKAIFGAGSDLQIYSDGTTGQVTGNVNVTGTVTADGLVTQATANSYTAGAAQIKSLAGDISYITNVGGDFLISNSSSTDQFVLSSSGNVGIGTSSPNAGSSGTQHSVLTVKGSGSLGNGIFELIQNGTSGNGQTLGDIKFFDSANHNVSIEALRDTTTSSGLLTFKTRAPAGALAERMRIDASGQLSLATTEDKARMTIGLTGVAVAGDTDGETMGENAIVHLLDSNSTATNSTVMLLGGGSGATGQIKSGIGFSRESGANWGTQLRFYTHSTSTSDLDELKERMRIDASGQCMIGDVANVNLGMLEVTQAATGRVTASLRNSSAAPYGLLSIFTGAAPNNTTNYFFTGSDTSTNRVFIYSNGNIVNANNSYGAISDVKLKENIIDASSQWDDIKALTVRKYSLKADNLDAPNMLGVIAQEVEAAGMGGLVYESPDMDSEHNDLGTVTKQVNYSIIYMKAVKALQEAMDRIERLEAKVAALES